MLSTVGWKSMFRDAILAVLYWIFGFIAAFKTDWVVEQAIAMERRYPAALSSRLAERSWYPTFIRLCGALLLLFAGISTLKIALELFAVS
jgi:hypothetical protein